MSTCTTNVKRSPPSGTQKTVQTPSNESTKRHHFPFPSSMPILNHSQTKDKSEITLEHQLKCTWTSIKMVHSAYDSFELLTNCPSKIESIESYGSKILLGCTDGSLLIYAPESERSATVPEEMRKEAYSLERSLKGFARRPVVSMQVVESRELLLSLSESIAFHRLPNFETIAVITKAKGANAFCWDERRGFLCFARQKRLCIFRHDGNSQYDFCFF